MHIPIAFPANVALPDESTVLAADVGGTKTDVGLFRLQNGSLTVVERNVYASREWASLALILRDFLEKVQTRPDKLCIAVAGPVNSTVVKMTNLTWEIDLSNLRKNLSIKDIKLVNDLEANAYGLAVLQPAELRNVHTGNETLSGNAAIIAPGTGLGEAGMFWDGTGLHPFASEGGHCDFAPRSAQDCRFYEYLSKQYNHVSWERVISGPGIYNIYQFLRDVEKWAEPEELAIKIRSGDPAQIIGETAGRYAICRESLALFVRYLAVESASLALKFNAVGGLFIGGGIVPKIWNDQLEAIFLAHLFEVGRLRHLVENVPVWIILNSQTPLLGAAYYGLRA